MEPVRILIDSGHGGPSTRKTNLGTVQGHVTMGPDGFAVAGDFVEKGVNLTAGLLLGDWLRHTPGFDVGLTRYEDTELSFSDRHEIEQDFGADIVIAIHCNANRSRAVHALEVYYMPGDMIARAGARAAASSAPRQLRRARIIEAYDNPKKTSDNWIQHPRTVLSFAAPTLLVELGFASSTRDRKFLLNPHGLAAAVGTAHAAALEMAMAIRS